MIAAMSLPLQLVIRLLAAVLLGALIGYERELRAKNAGVRTHIMVALGAALFMIISQYGFPDADKFDAARIAAGVVTGIGFIGGGIIMKRKHDVSGLTTAASLWVTGAVGLSAGCGMFEVAILSTVLVLACLEALSIFSFKLGGKEMVAVLSASESAALTEAVKILGKQVKEVSFARKPEGFEAEVSLYVPKKESILDVLTRLTALPGVQVESLE
jgi:putative Mg2+ transporter-C (MgtC) family protein